MNETLVRFSLNCYLNRNIHSSSRHCNRYCASFYNEYIPLLTHEVFSYALIYCRLLRWMKRASPQRGLLEPTSGLSDCIQGEYNYNPRVTVITSRSSLAYHLMMQTLRVNGWVPLDRPTMPPWHLVYLCTCRMWVWGINQSIMWSTRYACLHPLSNNSVFEFYLFEKTDVITIFP